MDAHLYWCSQRFSAAPLTALTVLLILVRAHTFPYIVAESRHAKFVYLVCQMLYGDPGMIPSGWESTLPIPVSPAVLPTSPLAAPHLHTQQLHVAADFLQAVEEGIDANRLQDMDSFCRGFETVIFHAVHNASARMDVQHKSFATMCSLAVVLSEIAGVPRSSLHPRVRAAYALDRDGPGSVTRNREADSPLSRPRLTLAYLQHLARVRNCNGPRCTQTVFEDGRPFPVCARCKTVRYCGPECQKRDWSSAELEHRHKDICPLLRRLLCTAEIGMDDEQWTAAFDRALDIEAQLKLYLWAVDGPLFSEETKQRMKQNMKRAEEFILVNY
ncbi:hypothetical protein EXIGLDRAFT_726778 [Exidia glandulosa HHB12029]|uniref:MYND-type domain-containing protein n=1 Tax=Exidia glandulosa HHB12029 TaxID=1314781 RepID=A0A165M7S7_EXIGL|nr:hypothetical protein EXIGLDRAFT_726778 [Exidia glandulosa HHB12029]